MLEPPSCSFWKLPPELRNHIYTFASYPTTGERCFVVPSLALAQSCRQIRSEYRPICLRRHVNIDWKDVPLYLDTFFPTRDGKVSNIDLAPTGMTIYTNAYCKITERHRVKAKSPVEIDLVPLLKMRLANGSFTCEFKYDPRLSVLVEATDIYEGRQTMVGADIDTLSKLLSHQHNSWLWDIAHGTVRKLMISHIGTEIYPKARFFVGPDTDNALSSKLIMSTRKELLAQSHVLLSTGERIQVSHTAQSYMACIELRHAFDENEFVFLWEMLWDNPR